MSVDANTTRDDRPGAPARPEYRAAHPHETFIVPLLKAKIEGALGRHAGPSSGVINKAALDVGCGRQPFRGLIEGLGFSYAGTDARQTPEGSVDFVCAIDGELPEGLERSAPFGLVLCTEVMEHVADWSVAFANFRRLTEVGGVVILTCPFFFPLHEEPYDFWRPTLHALRHFAGRAGFNVIECEAAGDPWDVVGTLLGCIRPYPAGPGLISGVVGVIRRRTLAAAFWVLRLGILRRAMPLRGGVYLANIVVLEKL